jgi:cupin fold WbuC family metalloprotein
MNQAQDIPRLSEQEISDCLLRAANSERRRFPKLLHKPGDEFNRVFNFIMQDSYMQPHLHPGPEKIEEIHVVRGRVAILYFNDQGVVNACTILGSDGVERIEVPAFKWHTYVMLTDYAITYETMMGTYKPDTWKRLAAWAPQENSAESHGYHNLLREEALKWIS